MKILYVIIKALFVVLAVALVAAITHPEFGLFPDTPSIQAPGEPGTGPSTWSHIQTYTLGPPSDWSTARV